MTNVTPEELNYHNYSTRKYDRDIVNSIPGYKDLHEKIALTVKKLNPNPKILELGVGTGNTTAVIAENTESPIFTLVDFSETMMNGAKFKLAKLNCKYILKDYSKIEFSSKFDLVVSVIGFHHQESNTDKRKMIHKIYKALKKDGLFILGDLMTYDNKELASTSEAKHYHFLVENSVDERTLGEWSYHHKYLNNLASIESHVKWMNEIGFNTKILFRKFNTVLILGRKNSM